MTIYIIAALLLAFLQTWLIPASFNMKNFPWLGSNRDEPMPHELTVMAGRAMRANTNLQETLPIFLALALLSMHCLLMLLAWHFGGLHLELDMLLHT